MRNLFLATLVATIFSVSAMADGVYILPMDKNMGEMWNDWGTPSLQNLNRYQIEINFSSDGGWDIAGCNGYANFDTNVDFGYLCQLNGPDSIHFLGITPRSANLRSVVRWNLSVVEGSLDDKIIIFDEARLSGGGVAFSPHLEWRERGQRHIGSNVYYSFIPIEVGPLKDDWYLVVTTGYPQGSSLGDDLSDAHNHAISLFVVN